MNSGAVRVVKLSHAVADRLRSQILSGQLEPGESLPVEADLIEIFQVSRPTVREALRVLEAEGMISLSRGMRSATVQGPSAERAAEYAAMVMMRAHATVTDLHQVRLLLEPPMVGALARKKDRKLIRALEGHVERMEAAVEQHDFGGALVISNDFHLELVRAQANAALALVVQILAMLARDTLRLLMDRQEPGAASLRRNMGKVVAGYRQLIGLLREGNADEARSFWESYMQRSAEVMQRSGMGARRVIHRQVGA